MKNSIAVIGGGASGTVAAAFCEPQDEREVTLFEKNPRCGKKILITGKGRCNLTNDCDAREFLSNVVRGEKFLRSAIYRFPPERTMELFESLGVPLKTERGRRVFPVSENAADIRDALENLVRSRGVKLIHARVKSVKKADGGFEVMYDGGAKRFDRVIIATGGLSYPGTGSTGDGYGFARELGHRVTELSGSLTGLICREKDICKALEGLSLKNVRVDLSGKKGTVYSQQGEMLFTDDGVSGPLILSASAHVESGDDYRVYIDLKPALTAEELDKRLLGDFSQNINRDLINSLDALLPKRLIPVTVALSGIDPRQKVNTVSREQRKKLLGVLKGFPLTVEKKEPVERAVVTRGGVDLTQIDPGTMGSKLVPGLYFCGEILDADAYTGGFNLQIAFATGAAAGTAAKEGK